MIQATTYYRISQPKIREMIAMEVIFGVHSLKDENTEFVMNPQGKLVITLILDLNFLYICFEVKGEIGKRSTL